MKNSYDTKNYFLLSEFRRSIRAFLLTSERDARDAGLDNQQYLALLHLISLPKSVRPTARALAQRMIIRHHSMVELIDRMTDKGLTRRKPSTADHREVIIEVTPKGRKVITQLANKRLKELQENGPALLRSLQKILRSHHTDS